ncbi:hypothetical protein E2C01_020907 [Portunus trituberculatus]|uniref:Uncharacterized protein n=1 Tax=Portunus trituberculatus TaxID=210409 RepID=A0A5B7E1U8_PORTR|nr:hypothetical protein [Portunus trituberculatus]
MNKVGRPRQASLVHNVAWRAIVWSALRSLSAALRHAAREVADCPRTRGTASREPLPTLSLVFATDATLAGLKGLATPADHEASRSIGGIGGLSPPPPPSPASLHSTTSTNATTNIGSTLHLSLSSTAIPSPHNHNHTTTIFPLHLSISTPCTPLHNFIHLATSTSLLVLHRYKPSLTPPQNLFVTLIPQILHSLHKNTLPQILISVIQFHNNLSLHFPTTTALPSPPTCLPPLFFPPLPSQWLPSIGERKRARNSTIVFST